MNLVGFFMFCLVSSIVWLSMLISAFAPGDKNSLENNKFKTVRNEFKKAINHQLVENNICKKKRRKLDETNKPINSKNFLIYLEWKFYLGKQLIFDFTNRNHFPWINQTSVLLFSSNPFLYIRVLIKFISQCTFFNINFHH